MAIIFFERSFKNLVLRERHDQYLDLVDNPPDSFMLRFFAFLKITA